MILIIRKVSYLLYDISSEIEAGSSRFMLSDSCSSDLGLGSLLLAS